MIQEIDTSRVKEALKSGEEMTKSDVADAVGCSVKEAHNALVRLNLSGEAECIDSTGIYSNHYWRLTG